MKKRFTIIAVTAFAMAALAFALVGCGGGSVVGQWHFESMSPTEASLNGMSEDEAADLQAESSMLSVFMTDAQVEFKDDGSFEFTFLGDTYKGTWEKAGNGVHVTMDGDDYSSAGGTYEIKDGKLVFNADEGSGRLSGFEVVYATGPAEAVEVSDDVVTDTSDEKQSEATDGGAIDDDQNADEKQSEASDGAVSEAVESASSAVAEAAASGSSAEAE